MQNKNEDSTPENYPLIHRDFISVGKPDPEQSFCVLQYNILADALSTSSLKENFCKVPPACLKWPFRCSQLLKQILSFQADIICLQEVDHFDDFFLPKLAANGYHGFYLPKKISPCFRYPNNNGPDGVAIFFQSKKYNLKEKLEYLLVDEDGKEGNNGMLVTVFEDVKTKNYLIMGVTHLKAKKGFEGRRKAQTESCLESMKIIASKYSNASIILCGDFNGEPGEPFYEAMIKADMKSAFVEAMGKEPEYTTWKIRPSGEEKHTIDYVWHSSGFLCVTGYLHLMSDDAVSEERFPSFDQPSDHIPLCFEFTRN